MMEGSYAQIEPGMIVLDRDGEQMGAVKEVLFDEESRIFHGVVIKHHLFERSLMLPAGDLERLHERRLYTNSLASELEPYLSPGERHKELEEQYE